LSQNEQDVIVLGDGVNTWLGEVTGSANFNGDKYGDLLIGASGAGYNGAYSGAAYMILGSTSVISSIDLTITRPNLSIYGANAGDAFGHSVAGGDVNGDGYADMIVSADRYNASQGAVYVIMGHDSGLFSTPMTINLAITSPALTILGEFTGTVGGRLGRSVASGDINDDGFDDIVIGSYYASPGGRTRAGAVYAILGSNSITSTTPATIDLRSQTAALSIYGDNAGDRLGRSVAIGDVDGDGIADIIAGAYLAEVGATANAGKTYLFYGNTAYTTTSPITFDLSITSAHVTITGIDADDQSGFYVSSGDLNNDAYDDVIIGAYVSDGWQNGDADAGEVYAVYGNSNLSSTISLSTSADIRIMGAAAGDRLGRSVASSDINGDSYDDMILGASWADPGNPARVNAGKSYVIYGQDTISATILLSNTTSANIHILGDAAGDEAGRAVSGGDINGDGAGDIIVGALGVDNGFTDAGAAYVIYGSKAVTVSITPVTDTIIAGQLVTYTLIASNTFGEWDVTHLGVFTVSPAAKGSWVNNTYTGKISGAWVVTGIFQGLTATASLTVERAPAATIEISPDPTTITAGEAVTYTVTASDPYGNSWDVTGATAFTVTSGAEGSWTNNVYTSQNAGNWAITATHQSLSDTASLTVEALELGFNSATYEVAEDVGQVAVTVTLSPTPLTPVTVDYGTGNGDAIAGSDYLTASGTLTFSPGTTELSFTVSITDDLVDENDESLTLSLSNPSGAAALLTDTATLTISDNDTAGVTLSKVSVNVAEGGITDTYTVQLDTVPTGTVTISFNTGSQLDAIGSLTFAADISALNPQTVTVTASDDTTAEGDHRQLIVHSASGGGYDGVSISDVSARITDNDIAYTLSAGAATLFEGDAGSTTISFIIVRTGDITRASSVEYALGGTAVSGVDYNGVSPSPGLFNFSVGKISRTITMAVLGDYVDEEDESIIVSLSNPGGTGGGGSGVIVGSPANTTIRDDDSAGIVVNPTNLTIGGPDGSDVFTVALTSEPTVGVTVTLLSADTGKCVVSPGLATLNRGNWNTGAGITVTAVAGGASDGAQQCVIQTGAAVSSDENYNGLNPDDVIVTVTEEDTGVRIYLPLISKSS